MSGPLTILLVYGEGGHREQAMRLMQKMQSLSPELCFVHLTDSTLMGGFTEGHSVPQIRSKHGPFRLFHFVKAYLATSLITAKLVQKHKIRAVIGFGPGLCIPAFMVCTLFNVKKRIFFEDWCRFTSKSWSGKICQPMSTKFFVQNESLLKLYRNAEYAGRL